MLPRGCSPNKFGFAPEREREREREIDREGGREREEGKERGREGERKGGREERGRWITVIAIESTYDGGEFGREERVCVCVCVRERERCFLNVLYLPHTAYL